MKQTVARAAGDPGKRALKQTASQRAQRLAEEWPQSQQARRLVDTQEAHGVWAPIAQWARGEWAQAAQQM